MASDETWLQRDAAMLRKVAAQIHNVAAWNLSAEDQNEFRRLCNATDARGRCYTSGSLGADDHSGLRDSPAAPTQRALGNHLRLNPHRKRHTCGNSCGIHRGGEGTARPDACGRQPRQPERGGEERVVSDVKYPNVTVPLVGQDGNAMFIMGRVGAALKRAGVPREEINAFYAEAQSGNYDHLLQTVMKWVNVGDPDDDDDE